MLPATKPSDLQEYLRQIKLLSPEKREELEKLVREATKDKFWVPNPGRQTEAYETEAFELYYGGAAGGGKTGLICGLALNAHRQSLILRREFKQLKGIEEIIEDALGTREGYNSQSGIWRFAPGKYIELGAVQLEEMRKNYQGRPHDLKAFDELPQFSRTQYEFIINWCRSNVEGQRSRIVNGGNPPMAAEEFWVIERWAAWLDPTHPNPAKPGEIRWYTRMPDPANPDELVDTEVPHEGPWEIPGTPMPVLAKSRTFIPALLKDNPALNEAEYRATLASTPEPYRTMLLEGRFGIEVKDDEKQVIPTAWVRAAVQRWHAATGKRGGEPVPPNDLPMTAIGVDVAAGGEDSTVLARRHDWWFNKMVVVPGKLTPLGSDVAAQVVKYRRDSPEIVLDMGGGYGGGPLEHLRNNNIKVQPYNGAKAVKTRTKDRTYGFVNRRSQTFWRFREALDPSQPGGSPICLPDDPALVADLTAPRFTIGPRGIQVESKDEVKKRIRRSPDRGDAVLMAWAGSEDFAVGIATSGRGAVSGGEHGTRGWTPRVILGHAPARKLARR